MSTAIADDDVVSSWAEVQDGAREPLVVVDRLREFMDAQGLGEGELSFAAIGDGHSNVTYAVARGGLRAVLRRPPRGPLPPSAHDVGREARVIDALAGRARVPAILATCADPTLIGAPFYLMELVEGHVLTDAVPDALDAAVERRRSGLELIDALVELHAVDWRAAGLEGFGREDGYLHRQLRRFLGLWEHNKTRELATVETVARWLGEHMPPERPPTIVHGDYRLGNAIFAPAAPARLVAILDWELATIGDPLADVGYMSALWSDHDDPERGIFEVSAVTREAGFPARTELLARYEERSGRALGDVRWYEVLALWKAIVFMEGNYKRSLAGADDDPYIARFGEGIEQMAERAEGLIS